LNLVSQNAWSIFLQWGINGIKHKSDATFSTTLILHTLNPNIGVHSFIATILLPTNRSAQLQSLFGLGLVGQFTWGPNTQHGDKVAIFERQETIKIFINVES
jgi:hypothetical protein